MIADGPSSTGSQRDCPVWPCEQCALYVRLLDYWFIILANNVITARNTPPRSREVVHAGLWTVCLVTHVVQAA